MKRTLFVLLTLALLAAGGLIAAEEGAEEAEEGASA